jgi:hypothetical protein
LSDVWSIARCRATRLARSFGSTDPKAIRSCVGRPPWSTDRGRLVTCRWRDDPAKSDRGLVGAPAETRVATQAWPICTTMAAMGAEWDWAQLDPDFATGNKALLARPTQRGHSELHRLCIWAASPIGTCHGALSASAHAQSPPPQRTRASRRAIPGARRAEQSGVSASFLLSKLNSAFGSRQIYASVKCNLNHRYQ